MTASHYDEIYKDKLYEAEARYVYEELLDSKCESLLDLGCGTGRHGECFQRQGINVFGVDIDPAKIDVAKTLIPCERDDVRSFRHPTLSFDAVTSLFHVTSYQHSYADLRAFFHTARAHLKDNGRFVFDFWYGPAVLADRPQQLSRRVGGDLQVATPTMLPNDSCVDVRYEWNKDAWTIRMRYWFMPELQYLLDACGLRVVRSEKWMGGELGFNSWYGCIVARVK